MPYICSNNSSHVFDTKTADGYCPKCDWGEGFLSEGTSPNTSDSSEKGSQLSTSAPKEIGLAILLMDASESMFIEKAYATMASTREDCVVASASKGIFELNELVDSSKKAAYIMPVLFDEEVKPLFVKSVAEILETYKSAQEFGEYLRTEFMTMHKRTDINKALGFAKEVYDTFIRTRSLAKWGGPANVAPLMHQVEFNDGKFRPVPNVRVLIYTDGADVITKQIRDNPFKTSMESGADILMGAYFGDGEDPGCKELRSVLSKCPTHNSEQFFLINVPDRIAKLRKLFRMASFNSGFCPQCLVTRVDK